MSVLDEDDLVAVGIRQVKQSNRSAVLDLTRIQARGHAPAMLSVRVRDRDNDARLARVVRIESDLNPRAPGQVPLGHALDGLHIRTATDPLGGPGNRSGVVANRKHADDAREGVLGLWGLRGDLVRPFAAHRKTRHGDDKREAADRMHGRKVARYNCGHVSLVQLESFVAVAEEGQVSRAAQRLHVTQPPVTRRIRMLEDELGVELFERLPRGMRLSPAGMRLLPHARDLLARAEAAAALFDGPAEGPST